MAFGERNYPYKITWKDTSKPGRDAGGFKRGAIGCDGLLDADGGDFMRTASPEMDKYIFGPTTSQKRRDGAMRVMTNAADPGTITNDGDKGYRGVDE
jgi:hypothetical protein